MFSFFTGAGNNTNSEGDGTATPSLPRSEDQQQRQTGLEPCSHYERGCHVKAPCCGKFYPCRLCHDSEVPEDWEKETATAGQCTVKMDRHAIEEIRCNRCQTCQPVSNQCINTACGAQFGEYFCGKCRLFAKPTSAGIYHCDRCGICRVGKGLDIDFFHCDTCHGCFRLDTREQHICFKDSLARDCPICLEYMFTSREMCYIGANCGHAMHSSCFKLFIKQGYVNCPSCCKPLVSD